MAPSSALHARISSLLPLLMLFSAMAGCADEEPAPRAEPPKAKPQKAEEPEARNTELRTARCPADAAPGCRSASGRVTLVEAVDADGDGDAHLVLLSPDGVTAPGVTVVDVRRELRPRPLPRVGDRVSAAGPVFKGSYGQRQIEAVQVHVARAGG